MDKTYSDKEAADYYANPENRAIAGKSPRRRAAQGRRWTDGGSGQRGGTPMTITVSVFQYEWHCDEHHDGFLFGDVDESADRMIRSAMEHAKDFHANAEIDNQIGGHADE